MINLGKIIAAILLLAVLTVPVSQAFCVCAHHDCSSESADAGAPDTPELPTTDHSGCAAHNHSFVGLIETPLAIFVSSRLSSFFELDVASPPASSREIDHPPQLS